MIPPRFSKDVLAQMRLSQLRELARRLGVGRYSSMLRLDLLAAIQGQAPRAEASDLSTEPLPSIALAEVPAPQAARAAAGEVSPAEAPTWVWFQPLDSQWAIVRWGIHSADRQQARAAGGEQMALRITDVTDRPAQDGRPHTLQEVLVEAHSQEWHIPIPLGNRDYRVELGYRTAAGGWISLGFSAVAHMPADQHQGGSSFVPFSLVAADANGVTWAAPQASPGQHERAYQQASAGFARLRVGSEVFHEQGALSEGAAGGHLSGAGLWASGREASGAGLAARQRSFWLVADAELIVYGATDPAATLTVGSEPHALTSEGTFHMHMAFPDGDQTYPIEALAADGEQKRSITLDFRRTTPHAHVNTRDAAVAEWF